MIPQPLPPVTYGEAQLVKTDVEPVEDRRPRNLLVVNSLRTSIGLWRDMDYAGAPNSRSGF
jgi:hypothetical protein